MDGMESLTERKKKRISWWKSHGKQKSEDLHEKPASKSGKKKKENLKQQMSAEDEPNQKEKNHGDTDAGKKRYILFVGNLPFDLKEEEIKNHFRCAGGVKEFRLMTKKSGESKGCGFLEFENQDNFWKALSLNHSLLRGRKINVEVTCGGGGSGEERRNKLKRKKQRLKKARQTSNKDKDNKKLKSDNDTAVSEQLDETKCLTDEDDKGAQNEDASQSTCDSVSEHRQTIKGKKKLAGTKKRKINQEQKDKVGRERKKAKI